MSRPLISYPAGWTLSLFDDADTDTVVAELKAMGLTADELIVLSGPDARDGMERLGAASGIVARMRRGLQQLTTDQMPDLHVYEEALDDGRAIVGIHIADAGRRHAAIVAIRRHGGHFVNRFGNWATEEIIPWRGPMLDVPQHLTR
jgi:hypothetical protein